MNFRDRALGEKDSVSRQIPAFLVAGASAFVVDAGLTVLLAVGLGVSPYFARPPAVAVATLVGFCLNRAFTFDARGGNRRRDLARYVLVAASGQAVNYAVYAGALAGAQALGAPTSAALIALCVACGAGAAMALTFAGFRFFAFAP
ncbi:MAG TPA: GtrA family protein [Roseiarcus sp.]|nr:GtrA family protein [Roseiarcus sp.]